MSSAAEPSPSGLPIERIRELARAVRARERDLDRFTAPGFQMRATVLKPGRIYDSLDERFADLRAVYAVVDVRLDPDSARELPDGRIRISGEAHLTRADGGGLSTPLVWTVTLRDGLIVYMEGTQGTPE